MTNENNSASIRDTFASFALGVCKTFALFVAEFVSVRNIRKAFSRIQRCGFTVASFFEISNKILLGSLGI